MGKMEVKYKGDMLFEVKEGNHVLKIDVPDTMGGKDRALTPPQLMLASLASCAAAFAAKYCETAGIDTKDLVCELEYEKLSDPTRFTGFKINLKLPNVKESARQQAIVKSIVHCPVKATFESYEGAEINIVFGR